jgi:hypothetical protein
MGHLNLSSDICIHVTFRRTPCHKMNFIVILPFIPSYSNRALSYILRLTLFIHFYPPGMFSISKCYYWVVLTIGSLSNNNNNNNNNMIIIIRHLSLKWNILSRYIITKQEYVRKNYLEIYAINKIFIYQLMHKRIAFKEY